MARYESSIKQLPHSQAAVYGGLSNLENLAKVQDRIPQDKVKDFTFDHDSVGLTIDPVGHISLRVVERDEPKCVKFATEQSPLPFTLWVQVLPVGENASKMKLTLEAEVNPFIKMMVDKPLREGIEKIADALAMVPFS